MSTAETLELSPQQIAAHDDQRDLGQRGSASLIEFFKEAFPAGSWLLDAGGGSGVTVPALQACGSRVVVLDWSRSMLAVAGARTRHRCAGDLRRLPFPDGVFGGVHAAYAIQNVSDWQQALSECARVANATAPIVIVWGSAPADERLAGIESAYLEALGPAAGVRAERTGLTVEAATDLLASLGRPLQRTVAVAGEQVRTARQVVERVALNPYRVAAHRRRPGACRRHGPGLGSSERRPARRSTPATDRAGASRVRPVPRRAW